MKRPIQQPESDDPLFDPRTPGKARIIYTIIAMVVVVSLIVGMVGYAVWDLVF